MAETSGACRYCGILPDQDLPRPSYRHVPTRDRHRWRSPPAPPGLGVAASQVGIYAPLRERNWPAAVVASNLVGAVADSALFLWLAFGSLDHLTGQVVGKTYMVAFALPIVWWARRERACFAS